MHSTKTYNYNNNKKYNKYNSRFNNCERKKFAIHNRLSKDDKYLKRKGISNN